MSPGPRLSVLLVDDHAVVREGYRRLLERRGSIAVVGEASDAMQALAIFTVEAVNHRRRQLRLVAHASAV